MEGGVVWPPGVWGERSVLLVGGKWTSGVHRLGQGGGRALGLRSSGWPIGEQMGKGTGRWVLTGHRGAG